MFTLVFGQRTNPGRILQLLYHEIKCQPLPRLCISKISISRLIVENVMKRLLRGCSKIDIRPPSRGQNGSE